MKLLLLCLGLLFGLLAVSAAADGDKGKKQRAPRAPGPAALLGSPVAVPISGLREPSGIAYHGALGRLFVVGDQGALAELDLEGRVLRSEMLGGNLEDVAVHAPSGLLVVLSEGSSELIVVDPRSLKEKGRWPLDRSALLERATAGGKGKQGFEGLTFRAQAGHPGGGVFYLVHQSAPPLLVSLAFDPTGAPATLGQAAAIARRPVAGYSDLSAVVYVPELGRLLIMAEAADKLVVLDPDGGVELAVELPGVQQEGLAVDGRGALWVADDRGGQLLRFEGALEALRRQRSRVPAP